MKKMFKEYKVTQQRVWPYPNQISKGSSDFVVTSVLRRGDISGVGAQLLEDSVIADFNDFVFFDDVTCSCKTKYSVVIESLDDLSVSGLDESYEIVVDKEIVITAKSYVGAVYALATLQQLIRKKGDEYVIENAPLKIVDGPKVGFRSAMLDCSRHFLSVEFLKKQIKAMAFQKLNALHLHLTDGQSFPLDLGPYSGAIAQGRNGNNSGAYSAEEMYTREGIRELVDYARARGVRVIPEVDTPGHVYSWTSGYPEMMTCNDLPHQGTITCPEPPCGFFNLQDKFLRVKEVVTGVLGEVMDAFQVGKKGYGTYFHIGFDEVGCPNMKNNVCQQPSCTGVYGDLSVNYANWLLGWLKSSYSNVQVIMWIDQILTSNFDAKNNYVQNVQIDPAHVILQFWNLDSTTPLLINQLANKGFGIINSQSTVYYLDAGGEGSEFYFGGPQLSQPVANGPVHISYQKYWMTTYPGIDPTGIVTNGWPVSWEEIYLNNITWLSLDLGTTGTGHFQNIPLKTSAKSGGIIGASASLWGEVADETNVEQKFWPKAAAHAESLWRFNPNRPADNIINARFRMAFLREDLLRLGIHAGPIVPGDVFRNAPWGPLNSKVTSLMYDINQDVQQVPEGYLFYYKRFWDQAATCPNPVNPFCGPVISHTMNCDGTGKPYIQQGLGMGRKLAEMQVTTIAELLEVIYGSKALRKLASILSILSLFMILAAQFIASHKFMVTLGVTNDLYFIGFWAIVILYTAFGGLRAVIATDLIQASFFILIFASCLGFVIWQNPTFPTLPKEAFSFEYSKLIGWLCMPLFFMIIEQDMGQRCLATKSPKTVTKAAILAGIATLLICTIPILFGILAKSIGLIIAPGASVLMTFMAQMTNPILTALMGSAVLVAIISTADSLINAIGSNIAHDFGRNLKLRTSQLLGAGIGLCGILFSFYFDNIVELLIQSYELSISCLFIPIASALFKKKGNPLSAYLSIFFGGAAFTLFRFFPIDYSRELISLAISLSGYLLGELLQKPKLLTHHP